MQPVIWNRHVVGCTTDSRGQCVNGSSSRCWLWCCDKWTWIEWDSFFVDWIVEFFEKNGIGNKLWIGFKKGTIQVQKIPGNAPSVAVYPTFLHGSRDFQHSLILEPPIRLLLLWCYTSNTLTLSVDLVSYRNSDESFRCWATTNTTKIIPWMLRRMCTPDYMRRNLSIGFLAYVRHRLW